jgi:DNA-binding CsgD family transcriptional regulator
VADEPRYVARAAVAHGLLERARVGSELALRGARLARERGGVAALSYALEAAAWNDVRGGRWPRAVAEASEGLALARETGQVAVVSLLLVHLALVAAGRGETETCRRYADEVFVLADAHGLENVREWARCALALLAVGLGRLEEAVVLYEEAARRSEALGIYDRDIPPRPELVELCVRLGREDEARGHLQVYIGFAELAAPVYGAAVGARCRGILAGEAEFEERFLEALAAHEPLEDDFARARTLLCFGERLRRAGRRRDARDRLNEALEVFETIGAAPWAERARSELRASGEKVRRRDPLEADQLTPQELQIALQVAEGKTNKEVGAALFLSHKTVEFHLSRIFRKLDLHSRAELIKRVSAEGVVALEPV